MRRSGSTRKLLETFEDPSADETLLDHTLKHCYPRNVKTCAICRFWKVRDNWCEEFSAKNPDQLVLLRLGTLALLGSQLLVERERLRMLLNSAVPMLNMAGDALSGYDM